MGASDEEVDGYAAGRRRRGDGEADLAGTAGVLDPGGFAYTGLDGDPRVVPIGSWWDGSRLVMCTVPTSAKVGALHRNPRVAVTIDTEGFPPRVLLVRGTAHLELVDGVPEEYIAASKRLVPDEQFDEWEAGVRALYEQMTRITVVRTGPSCWISRPPSPGRSRTSSARNRGERRAEPYRRLPSRAGVGRAKQE